MNFFGFRGKGVWSRAVWILLFLSVFLSSTPRAGGQLLPAPASSRVVVIDPGHGGADSGLVGALGIQEKDITLSFSRLLQSLIQDRWGASVLLTRTSDVAVPDTLRVAQANNEKASLFLSIHLGSSGPNQVGLRLLYPQFSGGEGSVRGDGGPQGKVAGGTPIFPWNYFPDPEILAESQSLAIETGKLLAAKQVPLLGVHGVPLQEFRGLMSPGFLIELGQVPNAKEERRLKDGEYLQKIAQALVSALQQDWWVPGQRNM